MRKKIVAGNWKMNKNLEEGIALAKEINQKLSIVNANGVEVVLGTPFIHLKSVADVIENPNLHLSAQNCAAEDSGAYTGEISAEMLRSVGCEYVILGHSERRAYYGETSEILVRKVAMALSKGLKVIFCIGESLEEREAEKHFDVVKAQMTEGIFNSLNKDEFANIVIAYEPVWAIGTGKTATSDQAQEIHEYIRSIVADKYGSEVADDTTILYGGSCNAKNADELFSKPDVDGGLIGGASLKSDDFMAIIEARKQ